MEFSRSCEQVLLPLSCSTDCINWNMLTPPSDEAKELTQTCQGRCTGDPSNEFEVTQYQVTNEDTEEENVEEQKVTSTIDRTSLIHNPFFRSLSLLDSIERGATISSDVVENRTGRIDHSARRLYSSAQR